MQLFLFSSVKFYWIFLVLLLRKKHFVFIFWGQAPVVFFLETTSEKIPDKNRWIRKWLHNNYSLTLRLVTDKSKKKKCRHCISRSAEIIKPQSLPCTNSPFSPGCWWIETSGEEPVQPWLGLDWTNHCAPGPQSAESPYELKGRKKTERGIKAWKNPGSKGTVRTVLHLFFTCQSPDNGQEITTSPGTVHWTFFMQKC